jgi:hypothetical protein
MACVPLLAIASLAAAAVSPEATPPVAHTPLCTLVPGPTLALLRVEQETMLPFGAERWQSAHP